MELDTLKDMWKMDEDSLKLEWGKKALLIATNNKIKSILWESRFEAWVKLITNFLFLLITGNYIADNLGDPLYLIPGIVIYLFMIFGIVTRIRRLYKINKLNFDLPIAKTQTIIEKLRISDRYEKKSLYALIPILGYCFLLMIVKTFHLESFVTLKNSLAFLGGSVFIAILIVWFLNWMPNDIKRARDFLSDLNEGQNSDS